MKNSVAPVVSQFQGSSGRYEVSIVKGVSISVSRKDPHTGVVSDPRTFALGDMAEYDSYNLSYFAPIVAITEKSVTIGPVCFGKNRRLSLEQFCWRNHDFDLSRVQRENVETSYHI